LIEAIKDGKPELEILEPLYIYQNGQGQDYTPEMEKIYSCVGGGEQS
jgi:tRNA1(Val) A37 N6-methylase TrmN6